MSEQACTRCGGPIPANPANGQYWRLTTFWRGKVNQEHDYCSVQCVQRSAIQGLVNESLDPADER